MISVIISTEEKWGEELAETLSIDGCRIFRVQTLLQMVEYLYKYNIDIIVTGHTVEGVHIHKLLPILFRFFRDVKVIVYLNEYSPQLERTFRIAGVTYVASNVDVRKELAGLINSFLIKERTLVAG
ncbi:MAG: hypothetical protein DRP54_04055 [Spirochaetes bacterium]|nr:MAG: hypothetical protein DRP54_04055 [Spirochaetota bacterium]